MFAPTDVCGVIKGCEINNNAKCQGGGGLSRAPAPTMLRDSLSYRKIATLGAEGTTLVSFAHSSLLTPHSSFLIPHSSFLTLLALPLDETTVK